MRNFIAWVRKKDKSFLEQIVEAIVVVLPIAFLIRTFGYGLYQVPTGSMETTMLVGERFVADKFTVWFSKPKRGDIIACNAPTFKYSDNTVVAFLQQYLWMPGGKSPENWTKRVIAIEGDELKGVVEDDKPVLYLKKAGESEFKKLDEPYVNKYPLVVIYRPSASKTRGALFHESYDPACSYEAQPFYRMNAMEVRLGALKAPLYGWLPVEYPNTPAIVDRGTPRERNADEFHVKLEKGQYWLMGDNRLGSKDSRWFGPVDGKQIHGKIIFRLWSINSDESWWIVDLIKHPIDFWTRVRWSRCFEWLK